ncbi:MAG: hypothetical protein NUV84_00080 [Candidatus Uhrbacteria bacterium]|nr:hypothetical protein [Candidatus Uhrbacteria bacterium]
MKVFGCPETLEGIEHVLHGVMSDEKFLATDEQKKILNLREGITLFPWERAQDELTDINSL